MKLNLGCCDDIRPGWLNVDIVPPADLIVNLTIAPWPWDADTFEEIAARDVIEHLPDKRQTMNEMWRVCQPGAIVRIQVPHATDGDGGHCDPTHVSYWTTSDFEYYHPGIAERERFRNSAYYGVRADFNVLNMECVRFDRHWGGYVVEIQAVLQAVK